MSTITKEAFEEYCRNNNLRYKFENKFYEEKLLKSNWNNNLLIVLCRYGYIETLKWLLTKEEINIHANNEEAFRMSCKNGEIEVAKWLIEISKENGDMINIHANNEEAFRLSCGNGQQSDLLCKSLCFQHHMAQSAI